MNSGMPMVAVNKRNAGDRLVIWNIATGRYRVVSPTGRMVNEGGVSANGRTLVDLSDIPAGIYLIAIIAKDRTLVSKQYIGGR